MRTSITCKILMLASIAGILTGCGGSEQDTNSSTVQTIWRLDTQPEGAISVIQAKQTLSEGDEVVITGRVGGTKDPISGESPIVLITDLALMYCGQAPGSMEQCPEPWDYCCETPETRAAHRAAIVIVNQEGNPISGGLKSSGMKGRDILTVVGKVVQNADNVLRIDATGIFVDPFVEE